MMVFDYKPSTLVAAAKRDDFSLWLWKNQTLVRPITQSIELVSRLNTMTAEL